MKTHVLGRDELGAHLPGKRHAEVADARRRDSEVLGVALLHENARPVELALREVLRGVERCRRVVRKRDACLGGHRIDKVSSAQRKSLPQ